MLVVACVSVYVKFVFNVIILMIVTGHFVVLLIEVMSLPVVELWRK